MLKFYMPITKSDKVPAPIYIQSCYIYLIEFKRILRMFIKRPKLIARTDKLFNILGTSLRNPDKKPDIVSIVNMYINNLRVSYDGHKQRCYFFVPNNILCPNTLIPLNNIIRLLEYGTVDMSPLYWLRPAYNYFTKMLTETDK